MPSDVFAELRWRGLVHQFTDPDLGKLLASSCFTCYCGFDPTAESLTTAHLLQLLCLRRLQLAGHRPIAVAGGATGLIGDPSGRDTERSLLPMQQIEANLVNIKSQLERVLDFSPGDFRAVLTNNADWLGRLHLTDFLRDVGKHFPVGMMIAKESVRARLEEREQGISFAEFSYMLLQSYDYLHLFDTHNCRLQIGGSDQWGNITAGIELIRRVRAATAYGLTTPLLLNAEGKKMSKSEGGAVWLDPRMTSPYRFYQYWFNTDDRQVIAFLKFFTFLSRDQIRNLEHSLQAGPASREAQRALASAMTALVHGEAETQRAIKASRALFEEDLGSLDEALLPDVLEDAPSSNRVLPELDAGLSLVDVLVETGLASSRSEARSHLAGGGVYVNNRKENDVDRALQRGDLMLDKYILLRRGKKTHHLLRFS